MILGLRSQTIQQIVFGRLPTASIFSGGTKSWGEETGKFALHVLSSQSGTFTLLTMVFTWGLRGHSLSLCILNLLFIQGHFAQGNVSSN